MLLQKRVFFVGEFLENLSKYTIHKTVSWGITINGQLGMDLGCIPKLSCLAMVDTILIKASIFFLKVSPDRAPEGGRIYACSHIFLTGCSPPADYRNAHHHTQPFQTMRIHPFRDRLENLPPWPYGGPVAPVPLLYEQRPRHPRTQSRSFRIRPGKDAAICCWMGEKTPTRAERPPTQSYRDPSHH